MNIAVLVNAIDAEAAAYWTKHEFLASRDNPLVLFRKLGDIRASLAAAG